MSVGCTFPCSNLFTTSTFDKRIDTCILVSSIPYYSPVWSSIRSRGCPPLIRWVCSSAGMSSSVSKPRKEHAHHPQRPPVGSIGAHASGLQRLQKGADRRLGGRGIAGGHDRRLGRHGGHEWASAEVRKGGWAACRCATGGIRANFASSAEAPKGYGSVVRQPEVRVGAYTRAWPVSGARAGCSPSQDALRGRAYMPTLSILDASIGGFASRRETGVSQARWWPAHRLWVRAHATHSCASLLSRLN